MFVGGEGQTWKDALHLSRDSHIAAMYLMGFVGAGATVSITPRAIPAYERVLLAAGGSVGGALVALVILSGFCSIFRSSAHWKVSVDHGTGPRDVQAAFARILVVGSHRHSTAQIRCEVTEPGGLVRIANPSGGAPNVSFVYWPNDFESASRPEVGKYKVRWTAENKENVRLPLDMPGE
jgi:hypothetical protein